MTEFIDHEFISGEENTCEMDSNDQTANDKQNEANQLTDQSQCQNIENRDTDAEELEKLFQEKLLFDEQGKKLRELAAKLLDENKRLNREREQQERDFIKSETNAKRIAEVIRGRLEYVYKICSERRNVYKDYIAGSLKRLQEMIASNNPNKVPLQERQSVLEAIFATIEEQLEALETLQKPDYEILYLENPDCFDIVMNECTKLEESCSTLTSMILQDYY